VLESLRKGKVTSQNELASKALSRMPGGPAVYRLSPRRARMVASRSGRIRVKMTARRSDREMKRCPYCSKALERAKARDLFGEPTVGERFCSACGFRMPPGRLEPARYTFELA